MDTLLNLLFNRDLILTTDLSQAIFYMILKQQGVIFNQLLELRSKQKDEEKEDIITSFALYIQNEITERMEDEEHIVDEWEMEHLREGFFKQFKMILEDFCFGVPEWMWGIIIDFVLLLD